MAAPQTGPQTKTIDGLAVTCMSLEPADAYDLLPELAPVLGISLAAKAALVTGGFDMTELLRAASQSLGGGRITDLMIRLLRATAISADGVTHRIVDRASLSLAFAGRLWSAFAVAGFAFEVTYGNFSDVVARLPGVTRQQPAAP